MSLTSASEPIAVINIGGVDGTILSLNICQEDDPRNLAIKFVTDNNLPSEIIAKLTSHIQSHISRALIPNNTLLDNETGQSDDDSVESVSNKFNRLLNKGSQHRNFDNNSYESRHSTPIKDNFIEEDSHDPNQASEEYFNKVKESWSSKSLLDMRRAPDSLHHMKKSRSDSNLNVSLSGSVNGDSRTASRPRSPSAMSVQSTPNRPVHDRLYQEANHSQTRLDRLRERVEQQRESSIWSSSFM
jgi:hypothetical protein